MAIPILVEARAGVMGRLKGLDRADWHAFVYCSIARRNDV